jgi:uncharacterized protein YdeI (YjbR/CyaY-like superfamily)
MGKKDAWVDAYIAKSEEFARPVLKHLRALVHATCPQVEETRKWAFPHFMYRGMLCSMASFKHHCAFGFWHKLMRDSADARKSDEAMGQLGKIASLADLPKDAVLVKHIKRAMKLNEDGIKAPIAKKPPPKPVKVPDQVMAALKTNKKASANFEKMSPSHQREYIEWITEARRGETVAKRLASMLEWLAEGKSRNWKYEKY